MEGPVELADGSPHAALVDLVDEGMIQPLSLDLPSWILAISTAVSAAVALLKLRERRAIGD